MRYDLAIVANIPIFEGCIADWNDYQVEFVSWCAFYHNIYQDPDRPDNKTIENDELLDGWLERRRFEHRQNQIQNRLNEAKNAGGSGRGSKEEFNIFDSGE